MARRSADRRRSDASCAGAGSRSTTQSVRQPRADSTPASREHVPEIAVAERFLLSEFVVRTAFIASCGQCTYPLIACCGRRSQIHREREQAGVATFTIWSRL